MTARQAEERLQALFDNTIEEDELAELEEALALDAGLREVYKEYAFLHGQLEADHGAGLPNPHLRPVEAAPHPQRRSFFASLAAAAAIVAAAALGLYLLRVADPKSTIALRSAPDSQVRISHPGEDRSPDLSDLRTGSTIEVTQGTIELEFPKGVRSVITGPANLTLVAGDRLDLHEGSAWFRVPERAAGFQVHTSRMVATDLGTEFGVIHVPQVTEELHVFEGRVRMRSLVGFKHESILTAGESRQIGIQGDLQPAPDLAQPFAETLPSTLPHLHFGFDEVEGDRTPVTGEHPALGAFTATLVQSDGRDPSTRLIPGRFGQAIRFNGKGDIIDTNWPGLYGAQPLTIAFWLRPIGKPNYAGIVGWGLGKDDTDAAHQWKIVVTPPVDWTANSSIFRCSWGRTDQLGAVVDLPRREWSHLAVVYSGETGDSPEPSLRFYLNGEQLPLFGKRMPSPPRRPADLLRSHPLTLGYPLDERSHARQNFLRGALDELHIFEGALGPDQVRQLYLTNEYRP